MTIRHLEIMSAALPALLAATGALAAVGCGGGDGNETGEHEYVEAVCRAESKFRSSLESNAGDKLSDAVDEFLEDLEESNPPASAQEAHELLLSSYAEGQAAVRDGSFRAAGTFINFFFTTEYYDLLDVSLFSEAVNDEAECERSEIFARSRFGTTAGTGVQPTTIPASGSALATATMAKPTQTLASTPSATAARASSAGPTGASTASGSDVPRLLSISVGGGHTCGVRTDGSATCWGANDFGQATAPTGTFASVSVGDHHTCGVKTGGTVACWGANWYGEAKAPPGSFASVSAGRTHTCGLKTDGTVACWGPRDSQTDLTPPAGTFISVSTGWENSACGIRTDGSIVCWFGNVNATRTSSPLPGTSFKSLSAGNGIGCGVKSDNSLACWFWLANPPAGQQGEGTPPAGKFASVSVGSGNTCGVKLDGTVACAGIIERAGLLKDQAGSFSDISAGGPLACGVKIDGTVSCWGTDDGRSRPK